MNNDRSFLLYKLIHLEFLNYICGKFCSIYHE
jgi:hypothetical protein